MYSSLHTDGKFLRYKKMFHEAYGMKFILYTTILLFYLSTNIIHAEEEINQYSIAVLEFHNYAGISSIDQEYLTDDIVRGEVRRLLPLPKYNLMDKESMITHLRGLGIDLADCEGECEVDVGRNISVDYIITGNIWEVGSNYKITLKLYDIRSANRLDQKSAVGKTLSEVEGQLKKAVTGLLQSLLIKDSVIEAYSERRRKARTLALFIPGGGQIVSGQKWRGVFYSSAFLGAIIISYINVRDFNNHKNAYKAEKDAYETSETQADMNEHYAAMEDNWDDMKTKRENAFLSIYTAGGVYIVQLIDALIWGGGEYPLKTVQYTYPGRIKNHSAEYVISANGDMLKVNFSIRF
jgi:TolB-like protein